MNFNKYICLAFLFPIFLSQGCEKDKETENLSTITYYPSISINGNQWNTIRVGESFMDLGAVAYEGESSLDVKVSGTVENSKPGVYVITYTATNKDGFAVSEYRYIGVIAPNVVNVDISGDYKRNAGAQGISTVTRVSPNLYFSNNVGGVAAPDPSLGVYFYHYDTGKLGVPFQYTPGNAFECIEASIMEGQEYSWVVINPTYGTVLRTFIKQ